MNERQFKKAYDLRNKIADVERSSSMLSPTDKRGLFVIVKDLSATTDGFGLYHETFINRLYNFLDLELKIYLKELNDEFETL